MKSVQLSPAAESTITQSSGFSTGLLLGQNWDTKCYVLSAVATPPLPKSEGGNAGWSKADWFVEHARSLKRMLVGGVDIIGCYISDGGSATDKVKSMDADGSLRDLVYSTPISSTSVDRLLLKAVVGAKLTGESYTGTRKENIKPKPVSSSSLKTQAIPSSTLVQFHANLHVSFNIPIAATSGSADALSLKAQLKKALDSYTAQLQSAPFTIDGSRPSDLNAVIEKAFDSATSSSSKGKGKGGKGNKKTSSDSSESDIHSVDFFLRPSSSTAPSADAVSSAQGVVKFAGVVQARAFAHNKYSVAQALAALRADISNSLQSRLNILSEDMEDSMGAFDLPIAGLPFFAWSFPRRLFAQIKPEKSIPLLSDYLLPFEKDTDGQNRINEIFGWSESDSGIASVEAQEVCPDQEAGERTVEKTWHSLPNTKGGASSSSSSSSSSKSNSTSSSSTPSSGTATAKQDNSQMLMIGFVVLVVAISAGFLTQVL